MHSGSFLRDDFPAISFSKVGCQSVMWLNTERALKRETHKL